MDYRGFHLGLLLMLLMAISPVHSLTQGYQGVCSNTEYYSTVRTGSRSNSRSTCVWSWLGYRCYRVYTQTSSYRYYVQGSRQKLYCCSGYREVGNNCHSVCSPSCVRGSCGTDFRCHCPAGWNGSTCAADVDECHQSPSPCHNAHGCNNTVGSYICLCNSGYHLSGGTCVDVDECRIGTHTCQSGRSVCRNTPGSYECNCLEGYVRNVTNQRVCNDVNECNNFNGGCQHKCINEIGSYKCECLSGFNLRTDGLSCEDINECSEGSHNCTSTQDCRNIVGGFECPCKIGYEASVNGSTCVDTNECELGAGCDHECTNTQGSYVCSCRLGYNLDTDNHTCSDVNECDINNGGCEYNCENTEGSYRCSCPANYFLNRDGHTCTEYSCATLEAPTNGRMSCNSSFLRFGTTCQFSCLAGYDLEGSQQRTCLPSVSWSGTMTRCSPKKCSDKVTNPPPFTDIFQPCSGDFNTSCPVMCSSGYKQANESISVSSIQCKLEDDGVSVDWTRDPVCIEGDPCSSNPCFHDGNCTVTGEDTFICNCDGTGYGGAFCEQGILSLPPLPILTLGQSYQFDVEAHPDEDLVVSFSSAILQPNPSEVSLTKARPRQRVTLRPARQGFHQMAVSLDGSEKDLYDKPSPLLGVVKPSGTSKYFEERELEKGILDPGCCTGNAELKCPGSSHKVTFPSTCKWVGLFGITSTAGIVFASSQGLDLPLSIAGASFQETLSGYVLRPIDITQASTCSDCGSMSASPCGSYGEPGKCYCLTPSDVDKVDFLSSEALPTTFLQNTQLLLPQWLSFQTNPSQRSYSDDSSSTSLWNQDGLTELEGCQGLLIRYTTEGVYSVLHYSGQLNIGVGNNQMLYQPTSSMTDRFCFVVNLCDGPTAAVHISIPRRASSTIQQLPIIHDFISRGWSIQLDGVSSRNTPFFTDNPHMLAVKGSLENSHQLSEIQVHFSFDGDAELEVPSYQQLLSEGLNQRIVGSLLGDIKLSLATDEGNYDITGDTGIANIGDWSSGVTCGFNAISMTMNDNLYTRGDNVLTTLLSIPPNYIYGDRYQFDCPTVINLVTDINATLIGIDLNTDCHNLVFGRLEFTGMSHQVFLGQRGQPECLPPNTYDPNYPVVFLSKYKEDRLMLGNFITLNKVGSGPHAVTKIHPSTGEYKATFNDVTVMTLEGVFTSSMSVTNDGLEITSRVKIFDLYECDLSVSAALDRPWKDASYTIKGSFVDGQDGIARRLTEDTFLYLKQLTKQGVSRRNLVAMELDKAKEASKNINENLREQESKRNASIFEYQRITQDRREYNRLILELNRNLSLLNTESTALLNNLNSICLLMDCPEVCQEGLVTSDCSYQERTDRWGQCPDQCQQQRTETVIAGTRTYSCSYWYSSVSRQRNCGCGSLFTCSCSVRYIPRYCCCPGLCEETVYRRTTVTYLEPCTRRCVVGQDVRTIQRTCQTQSDCATLQPDEDCIYRNALCRAQRLEAFKNIQDEVAQSLRDLDNLKKAEAASNLRFSRLQIQLNDATQLVDEYRQNLDNLNIDELTRELERVETENKHLLELAKSLDDPDDPPFRISPVEFEIVVVKGSPKKFPLAVTIEIPSKGSKEAVTVPFDFENTALSFYQASVTIGDSIFATLTGESPGRRKRQIDVTLEKGTRELLEEQCVTLGNVAAFFASLHQSLRSLNITESQEKNTAALLAAELEDQTDKTMPEINVTALEEFNVTIDPEDLMKMAEEDDELIAIIELKQSLISRLGSIAKGGSGQNVFVIWKMEVNRVLNSSNETFGYSCSGVADCFTVAVNVLEGILQTAPSALVANFRMRLEESEVDLEELSTSVNLSLTDATGLLQGVNTLLADMIDLNYWCAQPPNITQSSNSNITVVENNRLELNCTAESDFDISYQWKKDEVILPMNTNLTLVIEKVQLGDTGFYTCDASNHVGTSTSSWSYVEVQQAPVFYLEPSDESCIVGDSSDIALVCNATSWPDPQFRWYYKSDNESNFKLLINRTGSILEIESPTESDVGLYRCEAWNSVASIFSRSARISVLRYTTAVMAFPFEYKLTSCDGSNYSTSEVEGVYRNALVSMDVDAQISQVMTSFVDNVTTVSFLLSGENITRPDLFPESLESISSRIVPSRRDLMSTKEKLEQILGWTSTYTAEGLNVCDVTDASEYKFVFQCGYGQQLDTDNNMLCINCPPGHYKTNTSKNMLDKRGRRFTVDHTTCTPCPPGHYQSRQGEESCTTCPGKVGTITGSASCEQACIYCCSKTSPIFRRIKIFSASGGMFLMWSVPTEISSDVERFEISVVNLSGGVPRERHVFASSIVRAYFVHNLARGGKYRISVRVQMKSELCAPATIVRTI